MKIYLCRHGETEWTLSGQHTGRTDVLLTEEGRKQAARLRERIKDIPFEAVFTSPKKRAMETCEGMGAEIDENLIEWDYGEYEGLTSDQIHQKSAEWDLFVDGAPTGETPDQVAARADQFLERIKEYRGNVAVFTHGHFMRVLTARFLGLEAEMGDIFYATVASLSILGYERGKPVVILWNSTGAI